MVEEFRQRMDVGEAIMTKKMDPKTWRVNDESAIGYNRNAGDHELGATLPLLWSVGRGLVLQGG